MAQEAATTTQPTGIVAKIMRILKLDNLIKRRQISIEFYLT